jgi:hypothetical protein
MWRVCAIAPSFVYGWRAFSSVSLCKYISMPEKHRHLEAAESDDELPLTQRAAVQVTKRPAASILTSQAEPRVVKVHKSKTSDQE